MLYNSVLITQMIKDRLHSKYTIMHYNGSIAHSRQFVIIQYLKRIANCNFWQLQLGYSPSKHNHKKYYNYKEEEKK